MPSSGLLGEVTKIRSSQTMGDPPLQDGSGADHVMFSEPWLHRVGKPADGLMPFPFGPRHCGQLVPA